MSKSFHAEPRFTRQQMLACVPGLSKEVFKQWIIRGLVSFADDAPVGKGRRRLYSEVDVMEVATLHEMARQGIMVSKAVFVWHLVRGRIIAMMHPPLAVELGHTIALTIHPTTGELLSRVFLEGEPAFDPADDDAPDVMVIFRVDRFIWRLTERMNAILEGKPVQPPPNPTSGEDPDFFRRWTTDDAARRVLVGLSFEETEELERLQDQQMNGGFMGDRDLSRRYLDLSDKHELARQRRLGEAP
jgi:hypothetical protein